MSPGRMTTLVMTTLGCSYAYIFTSTEGVLSQKTRVFTHTVVKISHVIDENGTRIAKKASVVLLLNTLQNVAFFKVSGEGNGYRIINIL
jgi:hypothetical protein